MAQTVAATAVLGPGKTSLAIGYRVLNLNGTTYTAFTTTNVAETAILGTYRVTNGISVPDAGGYIVFGTVAADLAETTIDSVADIKVVSGVVGSQTVTITIVNGTGVPLEGVAVWITSDTNGTNVIAGVFYTNTLGRVTCYLDAGTYYVWSQDSANSFTNPTTLVVS